MLRPNLWTFWSKLTSTVMGLAALFSTEAQANTPGPSSRSVAAVPSVANENIGQVTIRTEGQRIYYSENGIAFEALMIDNSPDGARLNNLLKGLSVGSDAFAVPVGRIIVADGGAGKHYATQADGSGDSADKPGEGK